MNKTLTKILAAGVALIALTFFAGKIFGTEKTTWDTEYPGYTFTDGQKAALDLIFQQFMQKQDPQATNGLTIPTTGKGITIATNTQSTARMGTLTLSSGTQVLVNSTITLKTHIFCQPKTLAGVGGTIRYTNGPGFAYFFSTTNSAAAVTVTNTADSSTFVYELKEGTP